MGLNSPGKDTQANRSFSNWSWFLLLVFSQSATNRPIGALRHVACVTVCFRAGL